MAVHVAGDVMIAPAITALDYTRRSPFAVGGRGGHKEWHHFCVLGSEVELLVNFSLSDDVRPAAHEGAELARLTVLVHEREWDGDVGTFDSADVRVSGGHIDLRFGDNSLRFADGAYRIAFTLANWPVRGELEMRPQVIPTVAPNIPFPDGPPLHWVIVPRLLTSGRVMVDGREHRLANALTYHDHNFGHFLWGHAFSWIWGFCLPESGATPWTLAFVRLADRTRTCALAQGLFVWKGARAVRVFREYDLAFNLGAEFLRVPRVFKVPRIMALLSPEALPDVPNHVEIRADADGDVLTLAFDAEDLGQVVIPSETDLSVTIINEVSGRARIDGRIKGEHVAFDGRGMCEFLST